MTDRARLLFRVRDLTTGAVVLEQTVTTANAESAASYAADRALEHHDRTGQFALEVCDPDGEIAPTGAWIRLDL